MGNLERLNSAIVFTKQNFHCSIFQSGAFFPISIFAIQCTKIMDCFKHLLRIVRLIRWKNSNWHQNVPPNCKRYQVTLLFGYLFRLLLHLNHNAVFFCSGVKFNNGFSVCLLLFNIQTACTHTIRICRARRSHIYTSIFTMLSLFIYRSHA